MIPATPTVTLHALDRAAQRWGIAPSEAAEAAIRQVLAEGEIKPGENCLKFMLSVADGLVRVAHVCDGSVVTVSTQVRGSRGAKRRKKQRKSRDCR
ncbi:hypothetical protein [Deinococcus carri]|uniref:hypothetical protein n=1 Tax=Deinococcus carri TaxID=1211323 RepID=UPI0031E8E1B6